MPAADYADELAAIDNRIADGYGTRFVDYADAETARSAPQELQYLLARRTELTPRNIGVDGLDADEAWARIRLIADEANFDVAVFDTVDGLP